VQFCPSVYEHAAGLIGKDPWEVSRNGQLISEAHIEAFRLYNHRPVVVGIDIYNLEAEAYGATVERPAGNGVPAISRHPYSTAKELMTLEPFNPKTDGRIPMVIEAAGRVADECPQADVRVPLSGPFSLATNLMGFENLLCEIQTGPDSVANALEHLVAGQAEFCKEIVRQGLDIAFFESGAVPPLMSPDNFRDIELGPLKKVMEETSAIAGHPVPCIIGGDTLPILDYILQTGTGYVCCPATKLLRVRATRSGLVIISHNRFSNPIRFVANENGPLKGTLTSAWGHSSATRPAASITIGMRPSVLGLNGSRVISSFAVE